jgi:hypothetical protein
VYVVLFVVYVLDVFVLVVVAGFAHSIDAERGDEP